jgi:hypothetical protein
VSHKRIEKKRAKTEQEREKKGGRGAEQSKKQNKKSAGGDQDFKSYEHLHVSASDVESSGGKGI